MYIKIIIESWSDKVCGLQAAQSQTLLKKYGVNMEENKLKVAKL